MSFKEKLNSISSWITPVKSWTEQIIKLSIIGIILILIICLWVFFLKYLLEGTSASQLYLTAFYGIIYLLMWGLLPALGLRFLVGMLRQYLNNV